MLAFIIAGLIAFGSVVAWAFAMLAASMSDSITASSDAAATANSVLVIGLGIAALVAASHWLPHIGW